MSTIDGGHLAGTLSRRQSGDTGRIPSKRESDSKNLAQRRARWLTRKWKVSTNGNDYLKTDGFHIVVFSNPGGWSGTITDPATGIAIQARRLYETKDKAKLGAFDGMIWLKTH